MEVVVRTQTPRQLVETALAKFGTSQISNVEFCRHIGLSEDSLVYVNTYWDPAFNGSMLYLSDELILGKLTDNTNNNAVALFIKRKLLSGKYERGADYIEVTANDEAVKLYYQNNKDLSKVIGPNRRFFKVSGECYKCMLLESNTSSGNKIRRYFLQIERGACLMKTFIMAQQHVIHNNLIEDKARVDTDLKLAEDARQKLDAEKQAADTAREEAELKAKTLNQEKAELERKIKNYTVVNEDLLTYKLHKARDQSIYIISTLQYARRGLYKIGMARKDTNARLSSLNTGHVAGDDMVVLFEIKTYCAQTLEKVIHAALDSLRWSKNREYFVAPFNLLRDFVKATAEGHEAAFDKANALIKLVNTLGSDAGIENIDWMTGLDESVFNVRPKLITITFTEDDTKNESFTFSKRDSPEKIKADVQRMFDRYFERAFGRSINALSSVEFDRATKNAVFDWSNFRTFLQMAAHKTRIPVPISTHKKEFRAICDKLNISYNLRSRQT